MGEELPKNKKKKDGCFISLIKGFGCFLIFLFFFSVLLTGTGYYLFGPIVKAVRTDCALPEFDGPTEHDFWSLQEKQLNKKDGDSDEIIHLTHGEYNALLSSIRIPPVSGVYLYRVRHISNESYLRYYLICSGYMLKKLVISFIIDKKQNNPYPAQININSWPVPKDSIYEKQINKIIKNMADSDKTKLLTKIISGKIKIQFEN